MKPFPQKPTEEQFHQMRVQVLGRYFRPSLQELEVRLEQTDSKLKELRAALTQKLNTVGITEDSLTVSREELWGLVKYRFSLQCRIQLTLEEIEYYKSRKPVKEQE